MTIEFYSNHLIEGSGFYAEYISVKSCVNESYFSRNGTLESLNYPGNYLNNQKCFYSINISDPSSIIELQFQVAQITGVGATPMKGTQCTKDYLEIYNGNSTERICGDWTGFEYELRFYSVSEFMWIKFVSDSVGTAPGFKASWGTVSSNFSTFYCPEGWVHYQNGCFIVKAEKLSWEEALNVCHQEGGDLVKITSESMQRFLDAQIISR